MNASDSKAVFLSYASQDAEAARRICEALRRGGVEVWFDADGGLEHGDEWDAKIRRQIKECVLFIPIISESTQARHEGFFRIEWELAAQRAMGIASGVPFILPVVIDDTREPDALVPDRFRSVQWTKLPGGNVPPEVLQRLLKLWSHRTGVVAHQAAKTSESEEKVPPAPASVRDAVGKPNGKTYALMAAAVLALVVVVGWWLLGRQNQSAASPAAPATVAVAPANPAPAAAPLSEARKLAQRAQALIETLESTREDYQLAEELVAQAKVKDTTDAEVCAIEAHIHESYIQRGWDTSDTRRESARTAVQRAIRLDPASFEARFAQARLLGLTGREGEERERQLRDLHRERPADQRILRALATVIDRLGRIDESAVIAKESAALPGGDPLALYSLSQGYWFAGRAHDAEVAIEAAIAQKPFTGALLMNVWYKTTLRGDIAQARQLIERVDPGLMQEDRAAFFAYYTELLGHNPDQAIAWLKAVPRDWLNDSWYRGPKGQLIGDAHALAGRPEAARLEWQSALKLTEQRLVDRPKDPPLLRARVQLLARLGQPDEAARQLSVLLQIVGVDAERATIVNPPITDCFIALGRKAEALRQMASFVKNDPNWAVSYASATLRLDPIYDSLHAEPGFTALLADVEAREAAMQAGSKKETAALPSSEAVQLTAKALALITKVGFTRDDLAPAEDFARRATEKEPDSAAAWGMRAGVQSAWLFRGWDNSEKRLQDTQSLANRALALDPNEPEALLALGHVLRSQGAFDQAEAHLRGASAAHPAHVRLARALGYTLSQAGKEREARVVLQNILKQAPRDPLLHYELALAYGTYGAGAADPQNLADALEQLDLAIAIRPFSSALILKAALLGGWRGDLVAMRAALDQQDQLPLAERSEDRSVCVGMWAALLEHRPDRVEAAAAVTARSYFDDSVMPFRPKGWSLALAHQLAGKDALARSEWAAAETVLRQRLKDEPGRTPYQAELAITLAWLGQRDEAARLMGLVEPMWREAPTFRSQRTLALFYAAMGDAKKTVPYLAAEIDQSVFTSRKVIPLDPWWDKIRHQPEFEAMLKAAEAKK